MELAAAGLTHNADHLAAGTLVLLGLFGLVGGIGITALGPGGVLVTIGLFLFSGLPPAAVSGTAIATNVGSGVLGTGAFARSGQLRRPATQRMAAVLIAGALIGTPLGVVANAHLSGGAFGTSLGVCVMAIGALLYLRERRLAAEPEQPDRLPADRLPPWTVVLPLGTGVAIVSGLFGLGGPLLSVPLLVVVGVPMLPALAAAQAQSIVIAGTGTIGYALRGAISWPLVLVVGVPVLVGVVAGWRLAQRVPTDRLRYVLAVALLGIGAYLILRNV